MAGLVEYASSDEDDEVEVTSSNVAATPDVTEKNESEIPATAAPEDVGLTKENTAAVETPKDEPVIGPVQQSAVPLGPSLPSMDEPPMPSPVPDGAPSSPYSSNRALIHNLTLPTVPNMDIPPSPPGSPPPGINNKLQQFLDLKKKGVHFNAKLENSSALKNPSLMDKLLDFVGIDEGQQYETTAPTDLWDPNGFPEWAFSDRLRKSREKLVKEKETEKLAGGRTGIEFVPSTMTTGASMSSAGGLVRGEKRKSGWK